MAGGAKGGEDREEVGDVRGATAIEIGGAVGGREVEDARAVVDRRFWFEVFRGVIRAALACFGAGAVVVRGEWVVVAR